MVPWAIELERRGMRQQVAWLLLVCACTTSRAQEADLMIDRLPFDRITLNSANDGAVIDVVLLDIPDRKLPKPLPTTGQLEVRQLSNPVTLYTLDWSAVEQVQLYEELILDEALKLSTAGRSADAFRTLQFLHSHYPQLPGLQDASEQYVKQEALNAFAAKKYDESLTILLSLYDINSQHRGLAEAVRAVSDRVINAYLEQRNFAAARGVLDLLKQGFPQLDLQNVATWENKFQQDAQVELAAALKAFDQQRYNDARAAIRRAEDVLPGLPEVGELMRQIDALAPQLIVGVHQLVTPQGRSTPLEWSQSRMRRLTNPLLVEMVSFGAEGGVYESRWATVHSDDSGQMFDIRLDPRALSNGIAPEKVSLRLLRSADPASDHYQADFAAVFQSVSISSGQQVSITWRRSPVRADPLVRVPLSDVSTFSEPVGVYSALADHDAPQQAAYELADAAATLGGPRTMIERVFTTEEAALAALGRGEVAVLDQVPPWQLSRLHSDSRVRLGGYRLPTVHVLRLNFANPLLENREFRRALVYGINRTAILRDLVLASEERPGFRTLTGPMPLGLTITDPVGYAYNQQLPERPYEPRLASVLATVARAALGKKEGKQEPAAGEHKVEREATPLVLAYPPEPVARLCCQSISSQLTAAGIPVELKELSAESSELPSTYDLLYTELAIHEPLVDARRLLGPRGDAGYCSSSMSLALERVDQSRNWREARDRLQIVHQVAYYDLPVIPLWQTIDSFAYHKSLLGLQDKSVSLYQNVPEWRVSYAGGAAR